jgi:hypothetical protein
VAIRLASLTAIATLVLMAALLLFAFASGGALFGISRFAIHYLFPFSLFAAVALVIFFVKLGSFYVVPGSSEATNLLPYARLADELTRRGLGTAQFVTLSPRDAGNLAIYLPEARELSPSARIEPPPPDPCPIVPACSCGAENIPCRRRNRRSPIPHQASC